MTVAAETIQEWIDHDPDPQTVAELRACSEDELAQRFSDPLVFGTAGLRGPVRGGPNGMNLAVVLRTTYGLAKVLKDRCLGGSTVVVGRDARHGSEKFALGAAEVLAAEGFTVVLLPRPLPTPVLAFAVRQVDAAAGIQITASHNPPADNGYKVYWSGGAQIISPTDREIEAATAAAPFADQIPRTPVEPTGESLIDAYVQRAATVRRGAGNLRVVLTALHGVGGATAVATLNAAGITDIHLVDEQFQPNPDFPTVEFPNPEERGASDAVLAGPPRWTRPWRSPSIPTPIDAPSESPPPRVGACCLEMKPVGCWAITFFPHNRIPRFLRWLPARWSPHACWRASRHPSAPAMWKPLRGSNGWYARQIPISSMPMRKPSVIAWIRWRSATRTASRRRCSPATWSPIYASSAPVWRKNSRTLRSGMAST
ncbi:phosphoglucomutase/phosphomannomutase, alpha/beta/alpha domain I family protein [Mycobacteroides abscessus 1948]|uniref:Phosphoglucomutase/phosphomannomutase, alpha/beta/alpha domain I family protein n=1 Tax=Mycobacteroides abscessus 1948 TaxID=1299323 RepID=A0A829QHX0_9MYCO|nr:phosphoglucomutase/phosphomannomutase, alpha/beta/alpha domain I family protein [Mycobacteroides abscessus 1948]